MLPLDLRLSVGAGGGENERGEGDGRKRQVRVFHESEILFPQYKDADDDEADRGIIPREWCVFKLSVGGMLLLLLLEIAMGTRGRFWFPRPSLLVLSLLGHQPAQQPTVRCSNYKHTCAQEE